MKKKNVVKSVKGGLAESPFPANHVSKFFKNGKKFSIYCHYRYGDERLIWNDEAVWERVSVYTICLDLTMADERHEVFQHEIAY